MLLILSKLIIVEVLLRRGMFLASIHTLFMFEALSHALKLLATNHDRIIENKYASQSFSFASSFLAFSFYSKTSFYNVFMRFFSNQIQFWKALWSAIFWKMEILRTN